mmetsp:Transcript_112551/g.363533  ORF Transcript_112551/g.363533 Transcript_112551/m.363533 type:complete len:255 (+) Transcript_112551:638-1402(+)
MALAAARTSPPSCRKRPSTANAGQGSTPLSFSRASSNGMKRLTKLLRCRTALPPSLAQPGCASISDPSCSHLPQSSANSCCSFLRSNSSIPRSATPLHTSAASLPLSSSCSLLRTPASLPESETSSWASAPALCLLCFSLLHRPRRSTAFISCSKRKRSASPPLSGCIARARRLKARWTSAALAGASPRPSRARAARRSSARRRPWAACRHCWSATTSAWSSPSPRAASRTSRAAGPCRSSCASARGARGPRRC